MSVMTSSKMILRPMDFAILTALSSGRNVAANLALELDSKRQYITERMGHLDDYGLVRRVGPSENVGLYEITARGEIALENREKYNSDSVDFEEFLESQMKE